MVQISIQYFYNNNYLYSMLDRPTARRIFLFCRWRMVQFALQILLQQQSFHGSDDQPHKQSDMYFYFADRVRCRFPSFGLTLQGGHHPSAPPTKAPTRGIEDIFRVTRIRPALSPETMMPTLLRTVLSLLSRSS